MSKINQKYLFKLFISGEFLKCECAKDQKKKKETDLVDSTKQRHKLAEQGGAQTGDVHEGTLMGAEETQVNLNSTITQQQQQQQR